MSARRAIFVAAGFLIILLARVAHAQQRPAPVAELAAGQLLFGDDGVVREQFFGGTARVYLSPRVSVGPEVAFVFGEQHSHLMLTGNLTYDLLAPRNGLSRRVTPFLVAGGGLFQTRGSSFNGSSVYTEGAFTTGGGVRARIGENVTAGVEARLGWEAHVRLNALVGVRLGR